MTDSLRGWLRWSGVAAACLSVIIATPLVLGAQEVRGRVVEAETGEPVPSVFVSLLALHGPVSTRYGLRCHQQQKPVDDTSETWVLMGAVPGSGQRGAAPGE